MRVLESTTAELTTYAEHLDQEAKEINRLFLDYDDTADAKKEQHMTRLTEKIDKLPARLHALSRQSAQPIGFFAVKQNEPDAVVIDASDGAGNVGRPHPHSGMIGSTALVIGDRA